MADFTVLNADDNGTGSLRDAINKANSQTGADRIVFDSNFFNTAKTIRLTTQLIINDSVTIAGLGQNLITISGDANNNGVNDNGDTRLFFVNQGTVNFSGLTLAGGRGKGGDGGNSDRFGGGGGLGAGGALFINNGTISVANVTFSSNQAVGGKGGDATLSGGNGFGLGGGGGFGGNGGNGINGGAGGGGGFSGNGGNADGGGQYVGAGGGGFSSNGSNATNTSSGAGGSGTGSIFGGNPAGSGDSPGGGIGGGGGGGKGPTSYNGGSGGTGGGGAGSGGGLGGNGGDFGGGGGDRANGGWGGGGGGYAGVGGFGGGAGGSRSSAGTFGGAAQTDWDFVSRYGGGGGAGLGGAIFIRQGSLNLANSSFQSNSATGGVGGTGTNAKNGGAGQGKAGAIFVNTGARATASGLTFTDNDAANQGTVGQTGIGTSLDTDAVYGTIQVLDTTPPAVPTITSPASTNDATPVIAGNAEPNSSVTLSINNSGSITTYAAAANPNGAWSIDLGTATPRTGTTPTLSNGSSVNISVTARDAAGNTSAAVTQTLIIDTTPPAVPAITSPASTNNTTPVIAGNTEPNSSITLAINNSGSITTYTAVANPNGAWSIDLGTATPATGTTPTLSNGSSVNISVTAKDAAGNTSAATSQTLEIDTTPPNAPTITIPANTNDTTRVIGGTAEIGSTISLDIDANGDGQPDVTYETTVDTKGNWSIDLGKTTPTTGMVSLLKGDSVNVSVIATDKAGNSSTKVSQTFKVKTISEAPSVILSNANTIAYAEGTPPIFLDNGANVTDSDSANFNAGKLVVSLNTNASSDDRLAISSNNNDGISISDNNVIFNNITIGAKSGGVGITPLVINLNADATPAAVQALLRNITYSNISTSLSTGQRSASITLDDGMGGITTANKTINVTANSLSPENPGQPEDLQPQLILATQNSGILSLTQSDSNILFNLATFSSGNKSTNEIGVFTVDDDLGTIDGISPNSPAYTEAAFKRAKAIFSSIFNSPQGFDGNLSSIINFEEGQKLGFYVISDSSTGTVKAELATMGKTNQKIFFSTTNQIKIAQTQEGGFNLNWQDKDSLSVSIRTTNEALPKGTELQMKTQQKLIDLRAEADKVSASFTMYREAMFNNTIGFYKVADADGTVVDSLTGERIAATAENRVRYAEVALKNRVQSLDMSVANQSTQVFQNDIMGGEIYAPFIIANGNSSNVVSNFNNVYFSYIGVNSDKTDHIRLLGNNVFGFEDLVSGGDKDFNDVIVKINIK